jgi:hypothetical protein
MKISELSINEGVLSSITGHLARKGYLGKTRQYAAVGAQLDKEKEAARMQQDKQAFQKFLRDLPIALAKAYASGVVVDNAKPLPEGKTSADFFRSLIESITLNESMSKEDFVKQYLQTLFKNYRLNPQLAPALQTAISEFTRAFVYNPKLPAEKHVANTAQATAASKIWQVYDSARSIQGAQTAQAAPASTSRVNAKYAFPKTDITVADNKGNDFSFKKTPTGGEWKDEAGTLITDPADQDLLNKLALERAKTLPATTQSSSVGTQTSPPTATTAQPASTLAPKPTTTAPVSQRRLAGASASPRQQMRQRP